MKTLLLLLALLLPASDTDPDDPPLQCANLDAFTRCMNGPGAPTSWGCINWFDADYNRQIDLKDFWEMSASLSP